MADGVAYNLSAEKAQEGAKLAYEYYGQRTNFKTFTGGDMLPWDDMPPLIKEAWAATIIYLVYTLGYHVFLLKQKHATKIARSGWNGKNMWLELQVPDEHSKMTEPYLFLNMPNGKRIPWTVSQADILTDDWFVVE